MLILHQGKVINDDGVHKQDYLGPMQILDFNEHLEIEGNKSCENVES